MYTCEKCGASQELNRFCVRCGNPRSTTPGSFQVPSPGGIHHAGQPHPVARPSAVAGDPVALGPVRLAHGEVEKKRFTIGSVARPWGWLKGELIVTDVRVIYRAHAKSLLGESRNSREIQIADINGVSLITRRGFTPLSLLTIALSLIIGFLLLPMIGGFLAMAAYWLASTAGFYDLYRLPDLTPLLYLTFLVLAAVFLVIRMRSTEVVFALFARSVEVSPITLSGSNGRQNPGILAISVLTVGRPLVALLRWLGVLDAGDASDTADLADTQQMYDEIGALILDIQNRGVLSSEY